MDLPEQQQQQQQQYLQQEREWKGQKGEMKREQKLAPFHKKWDTSKLKFVVECILCSVRCRYSRCCCYYSASIFIHILL